MYFLAITAKSHLAICFIIQFLAVKNALGVYLLDTPTLVKTILIHFTTSFTPYCTTTFELALYGGRLCKALNIYLIVISARSISGTFSLAVL